MWDAEQYLKYADERSRPFFDLLARVRRHDVQQIVDLGCGPGNLTRTLIDRWPAARVVGIDSSSEMLMQAKPLSIPGQLDFEQTDISCWSPAEPVDLIVSNAAFQWVDRHEALLPRLANSLTPGGTLAVQMPYHFHDPAQQAIEATKADPRWQATLDGVGLQPDCVLPLAWYIERLLDLRFTVDAWQTTYMHILTGEDPVLEWFKGTALRPLLHCLDAHAKRIFLHELASRLRVAYSPQGSVTLLPFSRIFFVATRQ